jgi:tRNA A37 methylthiotransferase MiaB
MLTRMRRNHTREAYLDLITHIRTTIPDVALSSDFICGFCDETEEEFQDTLTLLEKVQYDMAFLFAYSMREKTHAHRRMQDNVPEDVKKRRLIEMIDTFKRN